ncbi:MAG: carboxypeptidase-like regulatory domain-containing protein [Candidatus Marinimicrobia bacterium]|nr:carboxypeptidase-like regulatory domain-containing protein [Candidatus Neomarinimicrobiota bacterium]MCF7828380.1 carboxypeptidase-like regulatory domain-containing protein [Candidatus Neomarinimicrobiota bacterium]MCF7881026.1 carboxypeptidase-like regulatory domain-containing protein [Candidatus Neomarinimicrobiota bacterium]
MRHKIILDAGWTKFLPVALLSLVLVLSGCAQDPVSSPNTQHMTIEGQVSATDGEEGVDNAAVSLAKLEKDGTVNIVNQGITTTDSEGRFSIETDVPADRPVILVANDGNTSWQTTMEPGSGNSSGTMHTDINAETTVETDIFIRLHKRGMGEQADMADIRSMISASNAHQVMNNHRRIEQWVQHFVEHFFYSTKVKAEVADSTSRVMIKKRFLTETTSDSALVDSIIAAFRLDEARVDSILEIETEEDEEEHFDHTGSKLKIMVKQFSIDTSDTVYSWVKAKMKFDTDSTTRSDLVAAAVAHSMLTSAQVEEAIHREDDGWGWGRGWGDHDDDDDEEDDEEEDRLELKVEGNIALSDSVHSDLDELTSALDTSVTDEELELEFKAEKSDGEISVKNETEGNLTAEQEALWTAITEAVKNEVEAADREDAWIKIEIEND